jgi:putative colanic acid biosynthesis acetyltransferase WcaF
MHSWRVFILRCFGGRIGAKNMIYPTAKIWAPWLLKTGDVVTIAGGVNIYNPAEVEINDRSVLSQDCYVCAATHDYNNRDFSTVSKRIVIGPVSWICAKAIVLPGVTVGEGAVLGAGAVTSKDLKSWCVYVGNPARLIGQRNRAVADIISHA